MSVNTPQYTILSAIFGKGDINLSIDVTDILQDLVDKLYYEGRDPSFKVSTNLFADPSQNIVKVLGVTYIEYQEGFPLRYNQKIVAEEQTMDLSI